MKLLLLFSIFIGLSPAFAQPAFDTTGGRFFRPVFDSVQITENVVYAKGLYANGQISNLVLDVYQPFGDTLAQRPVIVLAHGGGFIQGSKADMRLTCIQFAKKGFVTISIQYRLGFTSITPAAITEMVIRASQDIKNSIRFLRKSASENNPFKIQPNYIFAGGFSAGAITAVHAAYLDKLSEIPSGQTIATLDSLHNNAQYPGIDWRFKAVLNIAGSVGDTNWIESGDTPITSFHGTADGTVPYISGTIGLPGAGQIRMFGSFSIFSRCQNLNIRSELRAFVGANHNYTTANPSFADTTEIRICRFLMPFLTESITKIERQKKNQGLGFSVKHSNNTWQIENPEAGFTYELFDLQGRQIQAKLISRSNRLNINTSNASRLIRLESKTGNAFVRFLPAFIQN